MSLVISRKQPRVPRVGQTSLKQIWAFVFVYVLPRTQLQPDHCVETHLRKEKNKTTIRKRERSNRTGTLWYSLWVPLRWLHCKEPERKLGRSSQAAATAAAAAAAALRYFFFHRNRKFTAQQRGLDFALVQARHSSKVISYFATKASSTQRGQVSKSKARWR